MHRVGAIFGVAVALALLAAGCGGGTTTVERAVTTTVPAPIPRLVIARRDPEAIPREPGAHRSPAACRSAPGGRVKSIPLRSTSAGCFQVTPEDRLLFVNSTGLGPGHHRPNPVHVSVGGYEANIGVGESALFPVPAGRYLGVGLHPVFTDATVERPSILVLPEVCAVEDPRPGESLCFAAGAPRCHGSELAIHVRPGGAAGGTNYQSFAVINRSRRTCTLAGFPSVVPLNREGRPIDPPIQTEGATTTMTGNHPRTIALEAGGVARFEMNYASAANYPRSACHPRQAAALRISLPGTGPGSKSIPYEIQFCRSGSNARVGRIE